MKNTQIILILNGLYIGMMEETVLGGQVNQIMSDEEMLNIQDVILNMPVEEIISRPGLRVNCTICGEEIMNEREILRDGLPLCRACAGNGYFQFTLKYDFKISLLSS